jgi:hypothetical protein
MDSLFKDKYAAAREFYTPQAFKYIYEYEVLGMHRPSAAKPAPESVPQGLISKGFQSLPGHFSDVSGPGYP